MKNKEMGVDTDEYLVVIDGNPIALGALTPVQMRSELMKAIDFMEGMSAAVGTLDGWLTDYCFEGFVPHAVVKLIADDKADAAPRSYEIVVDNRIVDLDNLTPDQLRSELIKALDFLEATDVAVTRMASLVEAYRYGRGIVPMALIHEDKEAEPSNRL